MKKILIVFGTRPEAIKMAPLVKECQKDTINFDTRVCVTAQHREMLDQVLDLFQITPHYDLNIMKPGQDLYSVTSSILLGIKPILEDFNPDVVLVHGDTATTFATSLAAFYKKIKIGHVEAGLRTGNLYSPWPEEGNRKLTGILTDYHFAPTETSQQNLLNEGVDKASIFITGNTVIDALQLVLNRINTNESLRLRIEKVINVAGPWAHELMKNNSIDSNYELNLVRGSHIVIDRELDHGYFLEVPNERRVFFVLPYQGQTLIGTTEVKQSGLGEINPSKFEIAYLMNAYNYYFINKITEHDIVYSFAGLRPLVKSSKEMNLTTREYIVQKNGNVISVFGGKWTTSRRLAKKVTKKVEYTK